jgi:hypothetical protein
MVAVGAASAQGTAPAQKPSEVIVLGCLESAQGGYVLRDFRSNVRYRIEAAADAVGWHVGHELEIHGMIAGSSGDMPTLKAETIIYISEKCSQFAGGKK